MRLIATVLALFVLATAAAAQEGGDKPSPEPESIALRPSEVSAETPATLLDLKRPQVVPPAETKPAVQPSPAARAKPRPKPRPRPPVTVVTAAPRTLALGAAPAPTPAPVAIPAAGPADEGAEASDDDDENDGGDGDD